jgi:hypothetical protein
MLTHIAIFLAKNAFRDYKTIDELFEIEPLDKEMYALEWDPQVLDWPLYQKGNGEIDSASVFASRIRELGFRAGYTCPPTTHDFRAEGLYLISMFFHMLLPAKFSAGLTCI